MDGPIRTAHEEDFTPLSIQEINDFFDDIDANKNDFVTFEELEAKLHDVHKELAPEPQKHHLHHPERRDVEKGHGHASDGLHDFLCSLLPDCQTSLSRKEFVARVDRWQVPSQKQTDSKEQAPKLPFRRRLRAYWAVHGPVYCFMAFVVALQIAFGVWQMVKYIESAPARAAFGWGVIVAKVSAGVLYPTLFFMLLSMSRHFATFLRRSYLISRFINWDLSQIFHIRMSICGLFFASLHAIGHLTGTFLYGSRTSRQPAVAAVLGPDAVPRPYSAYVASLPGWSGVVSLGLFWTISLLSMPFIRKRSYEIFQFGHLLMFPMIGLLCAHGTAALLQAPMLGYWLAFPSILVIGERSWRLIRGFMNIPARARILDNDTIEITCKNPRGRDWHYSAGQYILLQVPAISWFQWHPFTISSCRGDILQLHVKFDGDWTNRLKDLPGRKDIRVGLDGPFGAPAQRFYDYNYSIIVGGGIGITPFSAILTDLEEHFTEKRDPWEQRRGSRTTSRSRSRSMHHSRSHSRANFQLGTRQTGSQATPTQSTASLTQPGCGEDRNSAVSSPKPLNPDRRVDFHWTVREKNYLLWSSDLLNRAILGAVPLAREGKLDLNIHTHITAKRKNLSTHVFRYLLDSYRTDAAPYSALTGLAQPSHFGRPDFDAILEKHFEELVEAGIREKKVGVFYCGVPVVGEILSDKCHEVTAKARGMGLKIRYDFLLEVFG